MRKFSKGFTTVEIIIVIAIVAILGTVAVKTRPAPQEPVPVAPAPVQNVGSGGKVQTAASGVTSFVNDTNVTASVSGGVATLGWTGTLADGRIASAATWNAKAGTASPTFTGVMTIADATSTNFTVYRSLFAPTSTAPSLGGAGSIAINTTSASSSTHYHDGTAERALYDVTDFGFTFVNPPTNGTGTTTMIKAGTAARGFTLASGTCLAQGGTANVQIGNGTASTTMLVAGTSLTGQSITTISSNNAFNTKQPLFVAIGTFSSTGTTTVSCAYGRRYDY